jgi:hypothetical protein
MRFILLIHSLFDLQLLKKDTWILWNIYYLKELMLTTKIIMDIFEYFRIKSPQYTQIDARIQSNEFVKLTLA